MSVPPVQRALRSDQVALVRLGCGALALGLLALGWELLAHQAPYTRFAIPSLPAPVAQLRATALGTGLLCIAGAWLAPLASPAPLSRGYLRALVGTVALMLLTLVACAGLNVLGRQLADPEAIVATLVRLRVVTQGLAVLLGLRFIARVWTGARASADSSDVPPGPTSDPSRDPARDPTRDEGAA